MASADMLRSLTDEELRSLEGMERGNVEARIAVLRNIQQLLDSAVAQMAQYSAVMGNIGSVLVRVRFSIVSKPVGLFGYRNTAGPGFPGYPNPPGFPSSTVPHPTPSQDPPVTTTQQSHPPASSTTITTSPRPLVEGERQYSFTAGSLDPSTREEGETQNEGTRFTIGETDTESPPAALVADGDREEGNDAEESGVSPTHVDELRQRRLQRFNSMPASPVTDSSALLKDKAQAESADSTQQSDKEQ